MSDDKNNKWEMPKPVFRTSTGSLPRSLEETMSQSFQPNAVTIEIDEDDDILSILDTSYRPDAPKFAEHHDTEETLEIDRDIILELPPEIKGEEPEHKPIVVTAKTPDDATVSNKSESGLFVFVVILLIVITIVAVIFYTYSNPPTTP